MTKARRSSTDTRDTGAPEKGSPPHSKRPMAELAVGKDGLAYRRGYRGAGAFGYLALARPCPSQKIERSPLTTCAMAAAPSLADRELMAALAIEFRGGAYRFDGLGHDSLADAVKHARFVTQRQEDAGGR